MTRALAVLLALGAVLTAAAEEATPPVPAPLPLPRSAGVITLDGGLDDPGWQGAAVIDTFFETVFGDNRAPLVATAARVAYDDRYLYISVRCDDPEPRKIRAPYVDRDNVIGTDDNVAIFLDTRGDRRSAQEFRVSPRGIQGDAVYRHGREQASHRVEARSASSLVKGSWWAHLLRQSRSSWTREPGMGSSAKRRIASIRTVPALTAAGSPAQQGARPARNWSIALPTRSWLVSAIPDSLSLWPNCETPTRRWAARREATRSQLSDIDVAASRWPAHSGPCWSSVRLSPSGL